RCSLVVVGVSREQQQQGCSGGPDEDPFLLPFSAFLAGRERPVLRVGGPRGEGGHRWSGLSAFRLYQLFPRLRLVPTDLFLTAGAPLEVFQINGLLHFQSVPDVEVRQGTKMLILQSDLTILLALRRFTAD